MSATVSHDIEVECDGCGSTLDAATDRYGVVCVTPCKKCLDVARAEGFWDGYDSHVGEC